MQKLDLKFTANSQHCQIKFIQNACFKNYYRSNTYLTDNILTEYDWRSSEFLWYPQKYGRMSMKFNEQINKYLEGNSFSSGLIVDIDTYGDYNTDRFSILEKLSQGKNIVHLGCVDHLQIINSKIERNLWLHSRLCNKAKRCLGVDINQEGVNYVKNTLGYKDVICLDILMEERNMIQNNKWNYMVMGEILEHVDNPCLFLKAIKEKYEGCIERLIITVPNAFSWQNVKYSFLDRECINSDHRYWFTPYTLAKILSQAGIEVEEFWLCNPSDSYHKGISKIVHIRSFMRKILLGRYPLMRQTLVMVAKL